MAQRTIVIPPGFSTSGKPFPAGNAVQSDSVSWTNNDSVAHWPTPLCMNLNAPAGQSTSGYQGAPGAPNIPQAIPYNCALHPGEQGVLTIWAAFAAATPVTGVVGQEIQITAGGMPPVTVTGGSQANITVSAPGSSSANYGFVVAVASQPATYNINLTAADNLGVQISGTPITVTVAAAFAAVSSPSGPAKQAIPLTTGGTPKITVTAATVTDSSGKPASSVVSVAANASGSAVVATATQAGTYTVNLVATDGSTVAAAISQKITLTVS